MSLTNVALLFCCFAQGSYLLGRHKRLDKHVGEAAHDVSWASKL